MEQSYVVDNTIESGVRLDVFLADVLDDWTRSQIKKQIDGKGAFINGKQAKAGNSLKTGDVVSISFTKEVGFEDVLPENIPLDIVYEDEHILVINKPQGMVVHPAPGNYEHTLVNALLYHFNNLSNTDSTRPGIVHRIDKDTSGLLVVAKNNNAHNELASQFADHSSRRTYVALLEGRLKQEEGTIKTFLNRDKGDRKKYAVSDDGKIAITHFQVLERFENNTLCEFNLETGRTHQIRVHSKYMGHPIVGDKTYGFAKQKFNLDGQLLHAFKLELTHPVTKERMTFTCDMPKYFETILKKLKRVE
ncbi:MAG: RluA family pseudouridine synthase [Clostridia bacterium]|nr:RluA family pseudouridine synthase [Clostridia bacterium]